MRIAVLSDTHLTVPDIESRSLFPRHLDRLGLVEAGFLYDAIRTEIDRRYFQVISAIKSAGPWDMVLHLGDITGGWQCRGLQDVRTHPHLGIVSRDMNFIAPIRHVCPGNHDLGYDDCPDYVVYENMELLQLAFGSLTWSYEIDHVLLLGISETLFSYYGDSGPLKRLQHRQNEIIERALAETNKPFILFTHKPAVTSDARFLPYLHRLASVVYGDYHDPARQRLVNFVTAFQGGSHRGILCPSTAPLWWKGCAYLELTIEKTIVPRVVHVDLPRPTYDPPTTSALRCVSWMLR